MAGLPSCDKLEVRVTTKAELCQEYGVAQDRRKTTEEINELCQRMQRQNNNREIFWLGRKINCTIIDGINQ